MSPSRRFHRALKSSRSFSGHGTRDYDSSDSEDEKEPLCTTFSGTDLSSRKIRSVSLPSDIPHGFLAVYVGNERRRFVISTQFLSHRLFRALLKRSEEEFGFEYRGGLTIACEPVLFEHLLWLIASDDPAARTVEFQELLESYEQEDQVTGCLHGSIEGPMLKRSTASSKICCTSSCALCCSKDI